MTNQVTRSGLRLTKTLNDELTQIAHDIGVTKNALMVMILRDWLKANTTDQTA